jgi:hypothetical protein
VSDHDKVAICAAMWMYPEIKREGSGALVMEIATERTKKSGQREVLTLRMTMPRNAIGYLLTEIRKVHEAERAEIARDLAELKVTP